MLKLRPTLVLDSLTQLGSNRLCTAVCGLLRALWTTAARGGDDASWVSATVRDVCSALIRGPDALRANLAAHVLPILFDAAPGACAVLLAALDGEGARVPACSTVQAARMAALTAGHVGRLVSWEGGAASVTPEQLHAYVSDALQSRDQEQRYAAG